MAGTSADQELTVEHPERLSLPTRGHAAARAPHLRAPRPWTPSQALSCFTYSPASPLTPSPSPMVCPQGAASHCVTAWTTCSVDSSPAHNIFLFYHDHDLLPHPQRPARAPHTHVMSSRAPMSVQVARNTRKMKTGSQVTLSPVPTRSPEPPASPDH